MNHSAKVGELCKEVLTHFDFYSSLEDMTDAEGENEFTVSDKSLWENKEIREAVANRMKYHGVRFSYKDGMLYKEMMTGDEFDRLEALKKKAWETYHFRTKITVSNEKMDVLLTQLKDYKEIEGYFPYETKTSDVVIFLFPKDEPKTDWADLEICDAVIYDRSYEEYFKVKNSYHGITEVICNGVPCRTGLGGGGYFFRLRDTALLTVSEMKLNVYNSEVRLQNQYTEEEVEVALNEFYGKSLKDIPEPSQK